MNLFQLIYQEVRQIPAGKVATYGQIAKSVRAKHHKKISAQLVGWALHQNKPENRVPCHRVVNQKGNLAKNFAFGGRASQKQLLLAENISFSSAFQVDLAKHQFLPEAKLTKVLPQQKSLKENRPKPRL